MSHSIILRRLERILGFGGPALAANLAAQGARNRADLRRPEVLARLPRGARANVLYNPMRSIRREDALRIVAELRRRLRYGTAGARMPLVAVGSVRRGVPRSRDLDVLAVAADRKAADDAMQSVYLAPARRSDRLEIVDIYSGGSHQCSMMVRVVRGRQQRARHVHIDLFMTTRRERPFALFRKSGSKNYLIRVQAHAKRQGWRLNQYGLFNATTGRPVPGSEQVRSERDLVRLLGVTYHAPRQRNE